MMLLSRIQSDTQNYVDVTEPHYQWKTCWCHWSVLPLLTMLISMISSTMRQLVEVILKPVVLADMIWWLIWCWGPWSILPDETKFMHEFCVANMKNFWFTLSSLTSETKLMARMHALNVSYVNVTNPCWLLC